jgi:hypothetical protein
LNRNLPVKKILRAAFMSVMVILIAACGASQQQVWANGKGLSARVQ